MEYFVLKKAQKTVSIIIFMRDCRLKNVVGNIVLP